MTANKTYEMNFKITQAETGRSLGWFLKEKAGLSRRLIRAIKFGDGVFRINGEGKTVRHVLNSGEDLTIEFPPEKVSPTLIPEEIALDILYEDEHALVINKHAGVATIPSFQHQRNTVSNGVLHHLQKQGLAATAHPVTRLDRLTSGVLLFAKHRFAHDLFIRHQKAGEIRRRYIALIHGGMHCAEGMIQGAIGRREGSIIERMVRPDGQPAVTHYRVRETFGEAAEVEVTLETGRTHQIRVHFASLGHPLLGDDLYGGTRHLIARQALHSYRIDFPSLDDGRLLNFEAPIPEDFKKAAQFLKNKGTERNSK